MSDVTIWTPQDALASVFVDAKPAEMLNTRSDEYLCFVGVIPVGTVVRFPHYKKPRKLRQKLAIARQLVEMLETQDLTVAAVAVASRMNGEFARWGAAEFNATVGAIGGAWELDGSTVTALTWNGHRYEIKTAMGIASYAAVLPLIGLHLANVARSADADGLRLVLDTLPLSSSDGMALIHAILDHSPHQQDMWNQNANGLSDIRISNLGRWNDEGIWKPGKQHPGFTVADWLAVGVKATLDPENFHPTLAADSPEVAQFASIWKAAQQQDGPFVRTLNLEDGQLRAAVIAHDQRSE